MNTRNNGIHEHRKGNLSYGSSEDREHTTIFEEYMRNKLPPSKKTEEALFENAQMLVGAGLEKTGFTLSTAHYHVLGNPDVCKCLRKELAENWSDGDPIPPWTMLERLPYLKAIIQESLRLSVRVISHLPRVNHRSGMRYGEWVIPPGTPVSMSVERPPPNSTKPS
jgi:cytochrome P450